MPDDVRRNIAALFPTRQTARPTPEQVKAKTQAQSIHERGATTAGIVAGIRAASPALGEAMDRIMAVPLPETPQTREQVVLEMRDTAVAVRLLAYRRELVALGLGMVDQPDDAASRERVGLLTAAVHQLEQRFPGAAQKAHRELNGATR
jgi:hypothetical protein